VAREFSLDEEVGKRLLQCADSLTSTHAKREAVREASFYRKYNRMRDGPLEVGDRAPDLNRPLRNLDGSEVWFRSLVALTATALTATALTALSVGLESSSSSNSGSNIGSGSSSSSPPRAPLASGTTPALALAPTVASLSGPCPPDDRHSHCHYDRPVVLIAASHS
jgi:hypothetical protein